MPDNRLNELINGKFLMNRQFGALSGVAILLILLNHSIEMVLNPVSSFVPPPVPDWVRNLLFCIQYLGIFAVPIFLFISGSFLAYAAKGEPPRLSWKFIWSSVKHMLFPYLLWSILFYIWVYLHYRESYDLFGYVKNLLVGYPFHFVPLLIFYYLISPILVRLGKSYALPLILVIGIYQLFLLNISKPGILGFEYPEWSFYLSPPILRYTMSQWAIFFPLGLIYGLNAKNLLPKLSKFRWILLSLAIMFFIISLLSQIFKIINFPISSYISITSLMLYIPTLKSKEIPYIRSLEKIGRKTYGIYLMHLIVIDLILIPIQAGLSWLYNYPFVISLLIFILGLSITIGLMELIAKGPTKRYYRTIYG